MTPSQITSCFLPPQYLKYNKGVIPLKDTVDVFHVDLVQPLSKQDQSVSASVSVSLSPPSQPLS